MSTARWLVCTTLACVASCISYATPAAALYPALMVLVVAFDGLYDIVRERR